MKNFNPFKNNCNEDEYSNPFVPCTDSGECNAFAPDSRTDQQNPFAHAKDEYAELNPFAPTEVEYECSNPFYDTPDISELIEKDAFLAWCVELSNRRRHSGW